MAMEKTMNSKYSVTMAQKIELWNLERLIPYEKNAREHSVEQVAQIAASIVEFGFLNPILVDSNDGIVAGHGRLSAAKELALDVVPVVVLDHLTENQKKAYVLVDNKLAENATWNEDLLAEEIIKLNLQDFDLNILGWSDEELEALQQDGWASDIDDPEADGEHMDAIKARIVVELDAENKDKVVDAINDYCESNEVAIEIK
ncbi:MAG: ParB/Srx family N-terminal domain-containing protein [Bacteroidota bacterium]|nr:ParB/Srx family N-terminal domain-containing protein [Bacteroidota bacterium]